MTVREHYSHVIAGAHKDKKRKGAIARQKSRKSRSNKQQLQKLDVGNWKAIKERARLTKNDK